MTRNEFIEKLEKGINKLPNQDKTEAIRYYEEYFDEAGPENEENVIKELEDPAKISARIMAEFACNQVETEEQINEEAQVQNIQNAQAENEEENIGSSYKEPNFDSQTGEKLRSKTNLNYIWMIVLGVFAAPIAFPLAIAFAALVFSLFAVIFSLILSFFILMIALTASGVLTLIVSISVMSTDLASGLLGFGVSLILIGIGMLMGVLAHMISFRMIPLISRALSKFFRKISAKNINMGGAV